MQFQNPWGALAALLLIPLILLYILKQRHRELEVPSITLWNQVLTQWEAAHPWQKWRRNLLFFLQLLAILLLALALMRPVWRISGTGQNNVIVLDLSMSMQAREQGQTRLERAKAGVRSLVEGMRREEEASLILSGGQNELVISRSQDKDALLRLLDQVEAENGGNALEDALQMAGSLLNEENSEAIHVFTDRDVILRDERTTLHNVALGAENVAMVSVAYSRSSTAGTLSALGLLHNYGQAKTVNVELWGDGALLDVRECALEADSPGNVLFEGVDASVRYLSLAVSEEDALAADNQSYLVAQDDRKYRVLLQTERNVFLEKAILLREDIELYKTTPEEELPQGEYSLLIGDGWAAGSLPENQPIWLIAPRESNEWFEIQSSPDGSVRVADHGRDSLLRYVDLTDLRVAKASGLSTADASTTALAYLGEQPAMILREDGGVKRLAFGFDFHDSNLPLQKDFPILVQNILSWFLPERENQTGEATAGNPVVLALQSGAASYDVRLPDGTLLPDRWERQFEETGQLGFYTVAQRDGAGEALGETAFAVNGLTREESELRTASRSPENQATGAGELWRRWNLWPYLILLTLALMAVEWWVYHRGA